MNGLLAVLLALLPGMPPSQAYQGFGPPLAAARQPIGVTISVPGTATLGATTAGGTLSAHLGTVAVSGPAISVAWTATVSSSAFITGGGGGTATIPNSDVSYWSGPVTSSSGIGLLPQPGQPTSGDAVVLNTTRTAFQLLAGIDSVIRWNPTLVVAVPSTAATGVYTGTIVHSIL